MHPYFHTPLLLPAPDQEIDIEEIPQPNPASQNLGAAGAPPDTHSLPALKANVRSLESIEKLRDKLDTQITSLEQKATGNIHKLFVEVAFILTYTGAGVVYQKQQVSCTIMTIFTIALMISFTGGVYLVVWGAYMKLKRMIPRVKNLEARREELAKRAEEILKSEGTRIERSQDVNGDVENAPLHPTVKADKVKERCATLMESEEYLKNFEWYNKIFICAAIVCVILNGTCLCFIAYFNYCDSAMLGCQNTQMPHHLMKPT